MRIRFRGWSWRLTVWMIEGGGFFWTKGLLCAVLWEKFHLFWVACCVLALQRAPESGIS